MSHTSRRVPAQTSRTGPAIDAARVARLTEAMSDLSEGLVLAANGFLISTSSGEATPAELLDHVVAIAHSAEHAIAALVVLQRSQGAPLGDFSPALGLTADRLRKKYRPQAVEEELASRIRPSSAALSSPQATADADATAVSALRHPRQRLACALTLMWNQSELAQRTLAERMNVDRSHVARMLSGQRPAILAYVRQIAEHCGSDVELVIPLWEATVDPKDRRTTDPLGALRAEAAVRPPPWRTPMSSTPPCC